MAPCSLNSALYGGERPPSRFLADLLGRNPGAPESRSDETELWYKFKSILLFVIGVWRLEQNGPPLSVAYAEM